MLDRILEVIEKNAMLSRGDRVVVGVSGGPDSVALLHILSNLRNRYDIDLCVAHLNHCFRGEEAKEDAQFVQHLSSRLNLPCYIEAIDVPQYRLEKKTSPQLAAREVRYDFFDRAIKFRGANKLALAHNRDDQAETVLLRLIRGTGLDGLSGIPPVRIGKGYTIIRPFIETSRSDIEQYCANNSLDVRMDPSNEKSIYIRNKVRLDLLPYLKQHYNPEIDSLLAQTAQMLSDERNYLDQHARSIFNLLVEERKEDQVRINLVGFQDQPSALQRRLLRMAVVCVGGNTQNLSYRNTSDLIQFILHGNTGGIRPIGGGIILRKEYGCFSIEHNVDMGSTDLAFDQELAVPGVTFIPSLGITVHATVSNRREWCGDGKGGDGYQAVFDWERLALPIKIRNRKAGDRFEPLGMKGRKKVKDLFIDEKIPAHERNRIPLITNSQGVLWVVGYRRSHLATITRETKKILELKISKE